MPNYEAITNDRQFALFSEYNEHLRKTEEKYLAIFTAYVAGSVALIAARPPPANNLTLELWQLTALVGIGVLSLSLMWAYLGWKKRYHQHIAALMRAFGIPDHLSPFRPMGTDWAMIGFVGVGVAASLIAVVRHP